MLASSTPVAIVTGTSSGIGRATSLLLAGSGYRVYATVRSEDSASTLRLETSGLPVEVLVVDLTEEGSISRAVRQVLETAGRVDALVNNAGYGLVGAVEDLPRDAVRRQFEVNVFAAMQFCREVLPAMRAQRTGRIVNVSSLAGRVSVPLMGAYCATKSALEAFSDALRVEVKPFGIRVAIIEPGPVLTRFPQASIEASRQVLEAPSVYRPVYDRYLRQFRSDGGASAERVAQVILHALGARRPRSRYRVRWRETLIAGVTQILPKGAMDWGTAKWSDLGRFRGT